MRHSLGKTGRLLLALATFLLLSGCFVVQQRHRNSLVSDLGESVWPISSGIYSKTSVTSGQTKNNYRTVRRTVVRGQRVYSVDEKPSEFYAFYPHGKDAYVVENYMPNSGNEWVSAFSLAIIDPKSGAIGSFDNMCSDLSAKQRQSLFGSSDAATCAVRTANGRISDLGLGGLIDMLRLSMKSKGKIQTVYRLERRVTDALQ